MTRSSTPSSLRPPYRAILWDNDGILVDSERWYFSATREVLAEVGIDLTPARYFEHFLASSGGLTELATSHGFSAARIEELRRVRNARYEHHLAHESLPMAGVEETLKALRPHFVMGIVTSSRRDHFEMIHRRTGFLQYFDFTLTQADYIHCKPAPEPYLRAIERAGFAAAECLAIEDAPRGLAAARAADVDCWVIPTELSRPSPFAGANRILLHNSEMRALLLGTAQAQETSVS
jgi:HAD superfamily hydrolase (TIGR01509 family)